MKAHELVAMINETCKPEDEIYINTPVGKKMVDYNPDICLEAKDPTDQDEHGGWRDINHELIKGKPFHIW